MVNESKEKHSEFESRARDVLRSGEQSLDKDILSRLAGAREQAMQEFGKRNRRTWPIIATLAASLMVALVWSKWPQSDVPDAALLESMDLLTAEEGIEFYEDLEFLEWAELEDELLLDEMDDAPGGVTGGFNG